MSDFKENPRRETKLKSGHNPSRTYGNPSHRYVTAAQLAKDICQFVVARDHVSFVELQRRYGDEARGHWSMSAPGSPGVRRASGDSPGCRLPRGRGGLDDLRRLLGSHRHIGCPGGAQLHQPPGPARHRQGRPRLSGRPGRRKSPWNPADRPAACPKHSPHEGEFMSTRKRARNRKI